MGVFGTVDLGALVNLAMGYGEVITYLWDKAIN